MILLIAAYSLSLGTNTGFLFGVEPVSKEHHLVSTERHCHSAPSALWSLWFALSERCFFHQDFTSNWFVYGCVKRWKHEADYCSSRPRGSSTSHSRANEQGRNISPPKPRHQCDFNLAPCWLLTRPDRTDLSAQHRNLGARTRLLFPHKQWQIDHNHVLECRKNWECVYCCALSPLSLPLMRVSHAGNTHTQQICLKGTSCVACRKEHSGDVKNPPKKIVQTGTFLQHDGNNVTHVEQEPPAPIRQRKNKHLC